MIPLEITLSNFLTYDDNEGAGYIYDFRDHHLWSISGDNGAGKSSLFDVITYTLFGQHRGGAQGGEELLNKKASRMSCSFTFEHDGRVFRVTRTLTKRIKRNGEATYQPAAQIDWYDPGADAWRQVPGTETVRALEDFIKHSVLQFDYDTFISSVLLLQGESDKLIRAAPSKRFQHLSGILDLSRYRRLEERAKARTSEARAQRDVLLQRLQAQGIPSDEEVERAEALARVAHELHVTAAQAAEAARAATKRVEAYWALVARRAVASKKVDELTEAQKNATAIRENARELRVVSDVLPRLHESHACLCEAEAAEARGVAADEAAAGVDVDGAALAVEQATAATAAADEACAALTLRRRALNQELRELQPQRKLAGQLEDADVAIETAQQAIAGLDEQLEELPEITARTERLDALAGGQRLMMLYRGAREGLAALVDGHSPEMLAEASTAAATARADAESNLEVLRAALARSQQQVGAVQGELVVAKRTLVEREQAGAEGTCSHCGQKVTAAHIQQEIAACRSTVTALEARRAEAERCVSEGGAAVDGAVNALHRLRETEQQASARLHEFRRIRAELEGMDADEAMAALPTDCREALHGPLPKLGGALTKFVQEAKGRGEAARRQQELLAAVGERKTVVRSRDAAMVTRDKILEQITRERVTAVVARAAELDLEVAAVDEQEPKLDTARTDAAARLAGAQAELSSRRERKAELEETARSETTAAKTKREAAASISKGIAPQYLPASSEMIAAVEERAAALAGAEESLRLLEEAVRDLADAKGSLREVEVGIKAVAAADRAPIHQARETQSAAETAAEGADVERTKAQELAATLSEKRRDLMETRAQAEKAAETHHVYQRLAQMLGRSGIQLYVMKHDLAEIEKLTNPLLARISGGSLRLRIEYEPGRQGAEEIVFRCIDSNSADEALDVVFLSGGQKFRVAVALAAGIGQYAGLGGSLPSVIIDEGFGSLDESGRVEMLEAIRGMAEHFEKIIVVSHTDSFHDPTLFPARYELRKEGRRVRVTKSV